MAINQAINCLYGYGLYGYDLYSRGLYRHTGSSDDRWMADDSSGRLVAKIVEKSPSARASPNRQDTMFNYLGIGSYSPDLLE